MGYQVEHRESIENPEAFWRKQAEAVDWFEFPQAILSQDGNQSYRWFESGKLNTSYLALDHHVNSGRAEQDSLRGSKTYLIACQDSEKWILGLVLIIR